MLKEEDILYQKGNYWVCEDLKGYYGVYRDTITHAERCAIYKGEKGLEHAKSECDRRNERDELNDCIR
jgi:hypothetical protein